MTNVDSSPGAPVDSTSALRPPRRRVGPVKLLLFTLAPAVALLACLEIAARLTEWASPRLRTLPLPEEKAGLLLPDPDLIWKPKPDVRQVYLNVPNGYKTNRWGHRSQNFNLEKAPGEFRILSLGESTTFGLHVVNDDTYSSQLEKLLSERDASRKYRVINAGVSAYTSFQSLLYLRRDGMKFQPDLVLFYHEANDYLPTSMRNSANTEIGIPLSDREVYESSRASLERQFVARSAAFRALRYWFARREIQNFQQEHAQRDPFADIGMPQIPFTHRLGDNSGKKLEDYDERSLPPRVRPEERRRNLEELAAFCREQKLQLVVIHPAYADTHRHECVLTEFCQEQNVPMFDAYDALHPTGQPGYELYVDGMHPKAEGHRRLAAALADFLLAGPLAR